MPVNVLVCQCQQCYLPSKWNNCQVIRWGNIGHHLGPVPCTPLSKFGAMEKGCQVKSWDIFLSLPLKSQTGCRGIFCCNIISSQLAKCVAYPAPNNVFMSHVRVASLQLYSSSPLLARCYISLHITTIQQWNLLIKILLFSTTSGQKLKRVPLTF